MDNNLVKYQKYLSVIGPKIESFFERQKPYIFCREGCSICCESGSYPYTKVEAEYLLLGFAQLAQEHKERIFSNILQIKKDKAESGEEEYFHQCPFLIDNRCSVYDYRGLICRGYGLLSYYTDNSGKQKYRCPCCTKMGLNYANVYDLGTSLISVPMWEKTGIEIEPLSFNVSLKFLLKNEGVQYLNLDFGEQRPLIDWF